MKHTSSHPILRTLALSLLIVVTLAGTTNMFSASTAYADDPPRADAPPPPADKKPADAPAEKVEDKKALDSKDGADKKPADAPKSDPVPGLGNQTVGDILPGAGGDVILALSKVLAIILSMISHLLWPLLMFAGGLMKSDFLYTGAIDLKLSEMWIQVRNLVNIAYVLLLLAVALYNVLGLGEVVSMLELKKALPKIILGLVLVNFSYAGVKVVLDVVNVGTTFAFSIGRTDARLTQETAAQLKAAQGPICDTLGISKLADGIGKGASDAELNKSLAKCSVHTKAADKAQCEKQTKITHSQNTTAAGKSKNAMCETVDGKLVINKKVGQYLNSWNVDSSLMIMAIKFMNIQDLPKVSQAAANGGLTKLTINMLFSVVMFMMYAVSFIVLIIVLFARAAILWMIIIFSPVLVFNATFPIPGVGGKTDTIIKTLIAPMLIGFVLSIGFVLLSTMQNINYNEAGNIISNAPTSSIDTFQDLLIAIGSIVFLWKGIEFATSDTISSKITESVLSSAKDAGTWLASAPFKYAPLFQVATPHAGHGTLQEAGQIGVGLDQALYGAKHFLDGIDEKRSVDAARIFGINVHATMTLADAKTVDNLKDALNHDQARLRKLTGTPSESSDEVKDLKKHVQRMAGDNPALKADPDFKKLHEALEAPSFNSATVAAAVKKIAERATPVATPAAPQPAAAVAETVSKGGVAVTVVNSLKPGAAPPPDDDDVARAIGEFNEGLRNNAGMRDYALIGTEIGKQWKKDGVDGAKGKLAADKAVSELQKLTPPIALADAQKLVNAIKAAL